MSASQSLDYKNNYKTIFLSILGGALEVYDFIIFVFLFVPISHVFFPPETPDWIKVIQGLLIFSVGYIARPLGGILIAHFSDKYGRKSMFNYTILFMAIPCLIIGVLPGYHEIGYLSPLLLLIARLIQGAALGGEVPNAWVFVSEHAAKGCIGYSLGLLQCGLTVGYMLAALTTTIITHLFTQAEINDWAWRILFILGGVFGFIALWLRKLLKETPVFIELQKNKALSEKLPLKEILSKHKKSTIPAIILTVLLSIPVLNLVVVAPIAMQKIYQFDANTTFRITFVGIIFMNIGCVIAGYISDKIHPWKAIILYTLLLGIGLTYLYSAIDQGVSAISTAYIVAGLCSGIIGTAPNIIVRLFPANLKVSGISIVYNITYSLASSIFPILFISLIHYARWSMISFIWLMVIIGLIFSVYAIKSKAFYLFDTEK